MDNVTHDKQAVTGTALGELLEQVERDHGHEGASEMSDHLRDRMAEQAKPSKAPASTTGLLDLPTFTGARIGFSNKPASRDACQLTTVHLLYTVTTTGR